MTCTRMPASLRKVDRKWLAPWNPAGHMRSRRSVALPEHTGRSPSALPRAGTLKEIC